MTSKLLVLLRHAKSSWADPHLPDHDRPLNTRGRQAAALVGRRFRQDGPRADLVLCSSALRTRQTLERLELPKGVEVVIEDELYGATAALLLTRIRQVPPRYGSVLLIGHNPGIVDLASLLDRGGLAAVAKFPTGAVAVLHFVIATWDEMTRGTGNVEEFFTPKDLAAPDHLDA
jgi:phosphohistidine phosphatase